MSNAGFGWTINDAGDFAGTDGSDVLVTAPFEGDGKAYVLTTAGLPTPLALPLRELNVAWTAMGSLGANCDFGFSSAVADLDGDGTLDFAIGEVNRSGLSGCIGAVVVFSGTTGERLTAFSGAETKDQFGMHLAAGADYSLDGTADLLVSAPDGGPTRGGQVRTFSVVLGEELFSLVGDRSNDRFGSAVAPTSDRDGDGIPDLLIGVPGIDVGSAMRAGSVLVYSGKDRSALQVLDGEQENEEFGAAIATGGLGLLVGAPYYDSEGLTDAGKLYLFGNDRNP